MPLRAVLDTAVSQFTIFYWLLFGLTLWTSYNGMVAAADSS